MITKEQFIGSLSKEFAIIKHLAEKITPLQLAHKPTDGQRNMHELIHYMSYIFQAGTDVVVSGDQSLYKKYADEAPIPTLENFSSLMDAQEMKVRELIGSLTDEQLEQEMEMWGMKQTKALWLLNGVFKWVVGYKMQLFLYMKQSGTDNIKTSNLWSGMDQPPKE